MPAPMTTKSACASAAARPPRASAATIAILLLLVEVGVHRQAHHPLATASACGVGAAGAAVADRPAGG